jgi:hypothetical protein
MVQSRMWNGEHWRHIRVKGGHVHSVG